MDKSLKFIALSGTISVTENLYLYESEGKMMMIDCGVGFPDLDMHGVDLVIPDFSYIVKNKHKLIGILISHGHEDHIGALPFLLREVKVPIWTAPLAAEFLKDKFDDYGVKGAVINTFNPDYDTFDIGPFKIHPFRVTHSVPDSSGFAIDTPQGRIFHVSDYKMDQDPVDGMRFDIERAKKLASEKKVLFLASDCLGANKPGFVRGEKAIEGRMLQIAQRAKRGIFATAISSNIGRFQQMINVAKKLGRKVTFVGRSVQKKLEIAHQLGILHYPENLIVSIKEANKMNRDKIMYLVAGCYGQVGSSLYKIAIAEHDRVEVEKGDTMIFSADPGPPYSKESENFVIDELIDKGVDTHYYDLDEGLYTSGHGGQDDITQLFKIVRPKYFIPTGGSIRFMHSYKKLAVRSGARDGDVFILKPGDNVTFNQGNTLKGERIPTKKVLVHGTGIGDIGKVVLGDRAILGNEGVVVVIYKLKSVQLVGEPLIVSRGFVFEKINKDLIREASRRLKKQVIKNGKIDKKSIHDTTLKYLGNFFFQKTGRRPMILPVIVEV